MNCQFSFGPNDSYFCVAAGGWVCSEKALAKEVFDIFVDENHPHAMETPHDVAFAVEPGAYLMRWTAKDGQGYKRPSEVPAGSNYARLFEFVKSARPTRTTFGPGFSYFSISTSGCSWQNLPPGLEDVIQNCMKIRQPACVALGIDGIYVVIFNEGTIVSKLEGKYSHAEEIIRNSASKGGLGYIALSPFHAERFYGVYRTGGWISHIPKSWHESVQAVSKRIQPIAQKRTSSSAPSAPVAHKKTTWKDGVAIGFKVLEVATNIATLVANAQ
ncbi:hypothetical protein K438DRAFT_2024084 [Mycena galopus ATCC 62051]|nr:hypothetical protein K438DRAFT_2024084 [Mycena galopus ATCC 62051]